MINTNLTYLFEFHRRCIGIVRPLRYGPGRTSCIETQNIIPTSIGVTKGKLDTNGKFLSDNEGRYCDGDLTLVENFILHNTNSLLIVIAYS